MNLRLSKAALECYALSAIPISQRYELNKNEPPLAVLLAYSRDAGIPLEQIVDDELTF